MTAKPPSAASPEEMNEKSKDILLVVDTACCNPISMMSVIELAAGLQAGIQAVYVEDINLLSAVDLPFTREVSVHTATATDINSSIMIEKLRTDAENIKRQIEKIAVSHRVSLSFSSIRGQKTQVIRNRTEELKIVLIPSMYSTVSREKQPGLKHELVMLYDSQDPACEKALNIAYAQAVKNAFDLFVIADSEQSRQRVEKQTAEYSGHVNCQIADFSGIDAILPVLKHRSPKLLVLTEGCRLIGDEHVFQRLISSLESDILLIR
jgi:hypothetical protein